MLTLDGWMVVSVIMCALLRMHSLIGLTGVYDLRPPTPAPPGALFPASDGHAERHENSPHHPVAVWPLGCTV